MGRTLALALAALALLLREQTACGY